MAYDSTNEILSSSPTGITLKEISRCIKDYRVDTNGRTDLGMMCTSPKVEKWAKYKPVRHTSFQPLTDAQREDANYGLDVDSAHETNFEGLLTKAIASKCEFEYLKPRGASVSPAEPYREADFDGYWHKAAPPYFMKFVHYKGNNTGWIDFAKASRADLTIGDLSPTVLSSEDMSSCKLAILYRLSGETTGGGYVFPQKGTDDNLSYITLRDIEAVSEDGGEAAINAKFTLPYSGTYDIVAAITEGNEDEIDDVFWMFLPEGYFTTVYDSDFTGFTWSYAEDYGTVGKDSNGDIVSDTTTTVSSIEVAFEVNCTEEGYEKMHGDLYIEITDSGGSLLDSYPLDNFLVGGTTNRMVKTFTEISTSTDEPYADQLFITARIHFYETEETEGTGYYAYFNFLENTHTTSYQQPVSLKAIYDAMNW